jgi:hypothetical protein
MERGREASGLIGSSSQAARARLPAVLRERLKNALPEAVKADRLVRFQHGLRDRIGMTAAAEAFIAVHGDRVLHGPFQGMRYEATRDAAVARLLGSYEHEISQWIAEAVAAKPPTFIDLGTSDGYYAVGMKCALPPTDVHGFEISKLARRECLALAARNGVSITLHGRATAHKVARRVCPGAFVLSDIEGFEADIFTSDTLVAALSDATIVVELHDGLRPGVTDLVRRRLERTHRSEIVEQQPPRRDLPELDVLTGEQREVVTRELRETGGTRWGRFTPR